MSQIPWVRTRASALVSILIFALCLPLCLSPLMMGYGLMFLYLAAPCGLCLVWLTAGRAAADICAALSVAAFFLLGGPAIALAGAVYLLPAHAVFRVMTVKNASALKTGIAVGAALMLSQLALYVWVQALHGGKAYEAAARSVTRMFDENRSVGDLALISLNSMGVLALSPSFSGEGLSAAGVLTDAARSDLLNTLHLVTVTWLTAVVPALLVEMSVYQGAMTVLIPRRAAEAYLRRRARAGDEWEKSGTLPGEDTPQLRLWHLPRGWGWKIGILSAGYFLISLSSGPVSLLGQLMFYLFFAVFTIQGIALLNHIQCMRTRRRVWRIVVPLLILFIFQEGLCLLGCADQLLDIRRLRRRDNEDQDQSEV